MRTIRSRYVVAMAACAFAVTAMAACGGDDSSSGGSAASGSSDDAASQTTAKADAFIQPFMKAPSGITVTQPLPEAPQGGKTIVFLNCGLPLCNVIADGVKEASAAADWNLKEINFDSANPATLTAAFRQALLSKPVATIMTGIPPETGWVKVQPEYEKAGAAIIAAYLGDTKANNDTVIATIAPGTTDRARYGQIIANWFISDSGGKGHAVVTHIDGFPSDKAYSDSLVKTIEANCPDCKLDHVNNTIDQVGSNQLIPTLVSAMQSHPDAKYALPASLEFYDGLPTAMKGANVDAKVASATPTVVGVKHIQDGKFAAGTSFALKYSGWLMIDTALRHVAKVPLDPGDEGPMPTQLLLPGGDFPITDSLEPEGYQDAFKKLWKVG